MKKEPKKLYLVYESDGYDYYQPLGIFTDSGVAHKAAKLHHTLDVEELLLDVDHKFIRKGIAQWLAWIDLKTNNLSDEIRRSEIPLIGVQLPIMTIPYGSPNTICVQFWAKGQEDACKIAKRDKDAWVDQWMERHK